MKLTPEHVGKKVKRCVRDVDYFIPLFVGNRWAIGKIYSSGGKSYEDVFSTESGWELYTPPKKIVRMAPALTSFYRDSTYTITNTLYTSEIEAKSYNPGHFIKWPANDTMWVEVEVEG